MKEPRIVCDKLFQAYSAKRVTDQERFDKTEKARERAQQAHSTLSKLFSYHPNDRKFEPTSQHFGSVMMAWSRSRDYNAAIYCQNVFDRMVLESENVRSIYGPLADVQDRTIDTFVPTALHFRALLTCWGYSKLPAATKRVLHIYREMKQAEFTFDRKTYGTILYALSRTRSVEGAEHAEQILNELEANEITGDTFKASKDEFDSTNHNTLFDVGDDLHHEAEQRLSVNFYRSSMYAWCYCGAPNAHKRCALIFRRLLTAYEKSGWDVALRPDSEIGRAHV